MKKSSVRQLFAEELKRKRKLFIYFASIAIIFIIALLSFYFYIKKNEIKYVSYSEKSNTDYNVHLKENNFFESDYLDKGNQYISSLIDHIMATFNYKIELEKPDISYLYSYKVVAEVTVKDENNDKKLYHKEDILIDENSNKSNKETVLITQNVKIDYNYYNDIIRNFLNIYNLDEVKSTLDVKMYIRVLGTCEEISDNRDKESVLTISIPLATNTVSIDVSDNLGDNIENVMLCETKSSFKQFGLIMCLILLAIDFYLSYQVHDYAKKTRTAQNIYNIKLKKILKNYSSYIQKVENRININNYEVVKITEFSDMLGIRDTISQPILMIENKSRNGVYFAIPSSTNILYLYCIKVSNIEKEINDEY